MLPQNRTKPIISTMPKQVGRLLWSRDLGMAWNRRHISNTKNMIIRYKSTISQDVPNSYTILANVIGILS